MNAHTFVDVARETEQGKEHFRNLNTDPVPEAEPLDESKQSLKVVWPDALDDDAFETFFGGAGI
jgi:hypothetical protein